MMRQHIVQFAADNTNVFSGTFGALVPNWARKWRLQVVFSDSDLLFSARIGGDEVARDCGPHVSAADNLQSIDWSKAHFLGRIIRGATDFEVLLDCNVVTAGVGLAAIQWEA